MTTLTVTINGRGYGPQDVRDDLTRMISCANIWA